MEKRMIRALGWVFLAALLLTSCKKKINLSSMVPLEPLPQSWIDAPLNNSTLPFEPYLVVCHGSDPSGVTAMEFFVNGTLTNTASFSGGDTYTLLEYNWNPPAPGVYELSVRTKNISDTWGVHASAIVTILDSTDIPTPTPTLTPSITPTPTITASATPTETTAPKALSFNKELSNNGIYFGGCDPRQVTFDVEASEPVYSVIIFTRVEDKTTGERTEWEGVFSMDPMGGNGFKKTLVVDEVPDYNKYENGLLLYQLVAIDADSNVLGRSQTFRDLALGKCGAAPPPPVQPADTDTPMPPARPTPTPTRRR